jgi:crotonobetainyl-CoA:carnitine CoA-transferase CaiB-like acyl-CoA transferase
MFALHGRNYQGMGGQFVDISIFETQMASINGRMVGLLQYQYNGEIGQRLGGVRIGYPAGIYPCADGYVNITAGAMFWPRTVALLGMPELDDSKFAPPMGQLDLDAKQEFEETIWLPWTLSRTKLEVVADCQKFEIPSAGINNIDDVVDHLPQLQERGYFVEIDHPEAGKFRYTGRPIVTDGRWWQIRRPAPLLGQHNDEVAAEVEKSRASTSPAPAAAPSERKAKLPLEGIRIADMTVVLAGPYSTMFLGDMGAEVIRVESVNVKPIGSRGPARATKEEEAKRAISTYPDRDPGPRPWNRSANFNAHNRSKYSMTADLHTPEGKDIMRRLIEISDLFMENNAMGSMERLGLTYDVVSQWNPRIIMISTTGFGRTGPWAGYRGFGMQFEAAYGHASVMGYPDMDAEGVPAAVPSDASTGVTMAIAALMALRHREKTGRGMYIDISLGENFLPHLGELFMDYTMNGRVASSYGNRDQWGLVQGVYPCIGDDEWIAISIGQHEQWSALCRLMGRPELTDDPRFESMAALRAHHDDVDQIIGSWTADKEPVELFHRLQKEGIIAGYLMHEPHALNDPHVKERGILAPVNHPEIGTHLYPGVTFKISGVDFKIRKPAVRLGEDNDYIYNEVLKLTEKEYDNLKALGHIGMDYAEHVR